MDKDWKNIAKQYETEIYNLWNDMESARGCLENIMPKSLDRAKSILRISLESSEKVMGDIRKFS